jgi:hypothetical protein
MICILFLHIRHYPPQRRCPLRRCYTVWHNTTTWRHSIATVNTTVTWLTDRWPHIQREWQDRVAHRTTGCRCLTQAPCYGKWCYAMNASTLTTPADLTTRFATAPCVADTAVNRHYDRLTTDCARGHNFSTTEHVATDVNLWRVIRGRYITE